MIGFRRDRCEAVFRFALYRSRLAHDCVRCDALFRTRLDNNGQTSILARDGYDVNDPSATLLRHVLLA
jgi:hypothetical protein